MAETVPQQQPAAAPAPDAGLSLRQARDQIAGLLDDDGHYNPKHTKSRQLDYIESDGSEPDTATDRDDRGRFQKKPAEPADEPDTEVETEEPAVDTPDEDTEQGDTDEAPDTSADENADADAADTGITTLAEFAAALDMSLDELKGALKHSFSAAGEDVTVTLAELEKGYQKDADYRRSTAKLADERRSFEVARQATHDNYVKANNIAANAIMAAEQDIINAFNDPRSNQLRESDPGAWSAHRTELTERLEGVRQFRQQAAVAYDRFVAEEHAKAKQREMKALTDRIPDFGEKHHKVAREVLASVGLGQDEINSVLDHRMIVAALELGNLRSEMAAIKTQNASLMAEKEKARLSVKRIQKEIPKLQKPGKSVKPKNKATLDKDRVAKLRARAKKTGSTRDAAKVIEQFL